jgi:cytochrome c biogenesis protein CcmG, thiol:disulfide interchange protein DsbE
MRKIFLTAVLMLFPISVWAQSSQQVLSLTLKDIRGRQFSLSDYKRKVVLLNFWATWCPPCRTEIPELIKMQRQYRAQGLRIVGITYPPEKISEVRRLVRRLRMNYRVAVGTKATKALFTTSETLPLTVIIDQDGTVRDMVEGIMYPEEFDQKVKPLLSRGYRR